MSDRPQRIQRKRTKGWKMPPNTVYVGRGSKWGNRNIVGRPNVPDAETARQFFEFDLFFRHVIMDLAPLRGKNLACWCPLDQPCHADVLLKLANKP